jgi:hypothetical protein
MGGLIELILSYGIFLLCISLGLISVYQSLSDQKSLYEVTETGQGQTLERVARDDARAYALFVSNARSSNQGTADPTCQPVSATSLGNGLPSGFSVTLLQATPPSDSSSNWTLTSPGGSGATPLIAQLRRGSATGPIIAEEFLRC